MEHDSVFRDKEWLAHMIEAIDKIEQYTHGINLASFLKDDEKQDAVIRRLEILGVATKRISETTRIKYPEVRWRAIAGLRDVITHQYFGLSLDKIWNVTVQDLPDLKLKLQMIMNENHDK